MTRNRFTRLAAAAAVVLPLLLSGCAMHRGHPGHPGQPGQGKSLDPRNPQVFVRDGQVFVDQEVLLFKESGKEVLITWRLPANGPYRFDKDGIRFDPKHVQGFIDRCRIGRVPTEFTCVNLAQRRDFIKYDIYVLEGDKPLKPLDPFVINDW